MDPLKGSTAVSLGIRCVCASPERTTEGERVEGGPIWPSWRPHSRGRRGSRGGRATAASAGAAFGTLALRALNVPRHPRPQVARGMKSPQPDHLRSVTRQWRYAAPALRRTSMPAPLGIALLACYVCILQATRSAGDEFIGWLLVAVRRAAAWGWGWHADMPW